MEELLHTSESTGFEQLPISTLPITDSPDESFHGYKPTPFDGDTHILGQDCGYNSSASSTQHDILVQDLDDDDLLDSRASSRTSISSIPDSVLINSPSGIKSAAGRETHEHFHHHWADHNSAGPGRMATQLKSIHTIRQREAAFRKPSSVRAMQMHTEDEDDDEFLTPPKRRGHRMSDISSRSACSSSFKRSPYYSPSGSAGRPKGKKEYPLVLLHCNLLPPSLPVPGLIGYPDQKILKDVLPSVYWKRWKLLEGKVGSGVLRDRGVLISHPEDIYDLLEERLLESLELQRPRLDHGHFLGQDEDSEKEDQLVREDSATDGEQGEECPDCGGRVLRHNTSRKWEIKVFAANGLMRAGAWAAAWKEMEKVDVEVGLWLPSEVRGELERRLEDDMTRHKNNLQLELSSAIAELQHEPSHPRMPTPMIEEAKSFVHENISQPSSPRSNPGNPVYRPKSVDEIDLQTLLINYIRVLASDRHIVAIAFLTVLVAFLAIGARPQTPASDLRPFPQDMFDPVPTPTMSLEQQSSAVWTEQAVTSSIIKTTEISIPVVATSTLKQSSTREEVASSAMTSETVSSLETSEAFLVEIDPLPKEENLAMELVSSETSGAR